MVFSALVLLCKQISFLKFSYFIYKMGLGWGDVLPLKKHYANFSFSLPTDENIWGQCLNKVAVQHTLLEDYTKQPCKTPFDFSCVVMNILNGFFLLSS